MEVLFLSLFLLTKLLNMAMVQHFEVMFLIVGGLVVSGTFSSRIRA
jgi:hypothetical protein